MQTDAWKVSRGIEEEEEEEEVEEEEEEEDIVVWNYGGINYLLDISWCKKNGKWEMIYRKVLS
jgi:hypothetical protein